MRSSMIFAIAINCIFTIYMKIPMGLCHRSVASTNSHIVNRNGIRRPPRVSVGRLTRRDQADPLVPVTVEDYVVHLVMPAFDSGT